MIKNYFYIILFAVCLSSVSVFSQDNKQAKSQENPIEGLSVYPNPVSGDRVYISTKFNDDKEIVIYDVLGKKVLQTILTSKELNISSLNSGIYILQIKEGDATATRKLIVN